MSLSFNVYGLPASQGSKRHVGNGVMVESSKRVKPWRQDVKAAALRVPNMQLAEAFEVIATFYFPRPKSHFRTGKNCHLLREGAPQFVAKKPDIEKLERSTYDAITDAGFWRDDALIVETHVKKLYADDRPPGAEITITAVKL